jgi:adenosylcobinamide-phosphate synthase
MEASSKMQSAPVAVLALAFALDVLIAEPPETVHPVALFGRIVGWFDRPVRYPVAVGTVLAVTLPLLAAGVVGAVTALAVRVGPLAGIAVAGLALFSTVSLRLLLEIAREVIALTESDPEGARTAIRALVGRETDGLSAAELRSGAVESAAENLADGLVGPLLGFAIGAQLSLVAGVGAAAYLKAVNTMDSMLGYRSKLVGTASARLDDLVMWLPARLGAVLLALAVIDPGALWRARSSAREPASPNSGWPMATLAVATGVRLAKRDAYTLNASAELPTVAEADACLRVVGVAGIGAVLATGVVVWF